MPSATLQFRVSTCPPNKNRQIWSDPVQSLLLIELRKKALIAKNEDELEKFTGEIGIEVEICGRKEITDTIGDLDNLLSGVCDGLSHIPSNTTMKPNIWLNSPQYLDTTFEVPILYDDDKIIRSMKISVKEVDEDLYYTVKVFSLHK